MKIIVYIILSLIILFPIKVFAKEEYILPYPGIMPGNKLYKFIEYYDNLKRIFAFGNLSKYKLYTYIADKKLVEAKVLFEYKQLLYAVLSLEISESNFKTSCNTLKIIKSKNLGIYQNIKIDEMLFKYNEVLEELINITPPTYLWTDEKDNKTQIGIHDKIRKYLNELENCKKLLQ